MPYFKYQWRVVSYDPTPGSAALLTRWTLEDISAESSGDPLYLSLNPFSNSVSYNFERKFFTWLLGRDANGTAYGIAEHLPGGTYQKEDDTYILVSEDDWVLADIEPSGAMLPGEPHDDRRTIYFEILCTYRRATQYTPPERPLEDPGKWHVPSGDGDMRKCPGGASGEWDYGYPGKSDAGRPGACPPGDSGWSTIYSYSEASGQQWVYLPYFSAAVAAEWSAWERDGHVMATALSGHDTGPTSVSARVYNEVKDAGYTWYVENITDEPLEDFSYRTGPLSIYPQGYFLRARTCGVPNIEAGRPPTGSGTPPPAGLPPYISWPPLRDYLLSGGHNAPVGLDLRPYDLMLSGQKLTINNEQITIGNPEAGGGASGGAGASGEW